MINKIRAYAEADTTSTEKSIGANCCAEFVECAPSAVPTTEKSSMVDRSIIKYWRRYLEEMKRRAEK